MVDHILIRSLGATDIDLERELQSAFGDTFSMDTYAPPVELTEAGEEVIADVGPILKARVVAVTNNEVVVDVGLKSEGVIDIHEWEDRNSVKPGDIVDVTLEEDQEDTGMVVLSKRRADRILNWRRIVDTTNEDDTVKGKVLKKIKGGLLVDIGVPVFLPASQVDIRRPADIGEFIDRVIEAKILKIDKERRNIVISRRKLIEEVRAQAKQRLMSELKEGELRKGTVKNIADFGAFVDLGGIDGLLHITDMSWDRIDHPSQMLKIDQEVEVKILHIDREKEKIALGLKQKEQNPWEQVAERYPVGSRVKGEVVNLMNYGAFVKLEPGVEGLVHISEMSWTRRINHPSEVVSPNDSVDVVVLEINKDKQEISLGMKQTEVNPWTMVAEKYPPNTVVEGTVRNLTNYGAFVEIEEGIDGLLHISDMSWTKKVSHPSELLKKGDRVRCVVLQVDQEKMRVALGLKQMTEDPWVRAVPERYQPGMVVRGKITKVTNFGVFVELEQDLEGLLHVSELSDEKVENPQDVVKIGDEVDVKILRVDIQERKIGLSKKRADWATGDDGGDSGKQRSQPKSRRGGTDHGAGGLGTLTFTPEQPKE
ncbi:MAG: 30S ribosomal protein S1 [Phycisphaerae bacterium]|nr:30S ribosomal protein S1 [Phycisphaerae bacterium]